MAGTLTPDVCVVGAGSAGLVAAAGAAQLGLNVVLIERALMGGDCLNYGCVPSKALIAAAKAAQAQRSGAAFGIAPVEPRVDFGKVMDHVTQVIAAIAPNDSVERFERLGVHVLKEEARFVGRTELSAGPHRIKSRRIVLATGSRPTAPPVPGLADVPYLTNETVFANRTLPNHLIVIGGGPIGLELAQAYRRLGARVTVLEAADFLAKDDPELSAIVVARLRAEGVDLRTPVKIARVERAPSGMTVTLDGGGRLDGSHLLVAAGRAPVVEGLDLETAGVTHTKHGITVDASLRTSNRNVWAIGDCNGLYAFTHMAGYEASLFIRGALFRAPAKLDASLVPWVTFTDPELAQVGLTEDEAKGRGRPIRVLRWPYHENDRAQAECATVGHIKVVTDRRGRILGASIVGAGAGELIATWALLTTKRSNIRTLLGVIIPYPTLAEIGKRASMTYFTRGLTSVWVRRIIALLRRFG